MNSHPPGIPLTLLLDDLMPGMERALQVRRFNKLTNQCFTVETAEAHFFPNQHAIGMARMSWDHGVMKEENAIFAAEVAARMTDFQVKFQGAPPRNSLPAEEASSVGNAVLELQVSKTDPQPLSRPLVSLRVLLPELYSGTRDWSKWLKKYNRDLETTHQDSYAMVSADEARRAREQIPGLTRARQDSGRKAGGKAGLKKTEAKSRQKPGIRIF